MASTEVWVYRPGYGWVLRTIPTGREESAVMPAARRTVRTLAGAR